MEAVAISGDGSIDSVLAVDVPDKKSSARLYPRAFIFASVDGHQGTQTSDTRIKLTIDKVRQIVPRLLGERYREDLVVKLACFKRVYSRRILFPDQSRHVPL